MTRAEPPPEDVEDVASSAPAPTSASALETLETVEPPPPPATLDESDDAWRDSTEPAASHPLARKVLGQPDLIRTLVTATLEVSEGNNPRKRFSYLAPRSPFEVRGDLTYLRLDPASYRRYDALVSAFVALDTDALLDAYATFEPLFDEAYAELGYPGEDFDTALRTAVRELLAVPILGKPPALVPRAKTYAYEDPALEELSSAQRQLLRMGPENVRKVQSKLRELETRLAERS